MLVQERRGIDSMLEPYFERVGRSEAKILIDALADMGKYGVDSFGYRQIYKNGYSSLFSTNPSWKAIDKTSEFLKSMRSHMGCEIIQAKYSNRTLVTRSSDKVHTDFLSKLESSQVNNSVVKYIFKKSFVEVFYYMCNTEKPETRDIMLNNMDCINFLQNKITQVLHKISESKKFRGDQELVLDPGVSREVLGSKLNKSKTYNILLLNQEINFTYRELECLILLKFGCNNNFIAPKLGVSIHTIKSYISSLKNKLGVSERSELIEICQDQSLSNISNILLRD